MPFLFQIYVEKKSVQGKYVWIKNDKYKVWVQKINAETQFTMTKIFVLGNQYSTSILPDHVLVKLTGGRKRKTGAGNQTSLGKFKLVLLEQSCATKPTQGNLERARGAQSRGQFDKGNRGQIAQGTVLPSIIYHII